MKRELYYVKKGLESRKVPFEVEPLFDGHELIVRNMDGTATFHCVSFSRSVGREEGLIEIDGVIAEEDEEAVSSKEVLARVDRWLETDSVIF